MKQYSLNFFLLLAGAMSLLVLFSPPKANAEPVTQTITLHPGWNAVYFEVQPEKNDCETVFATLIDPDSGVDNDSFLSSAWAWNPDTSTVEFTQDPNEPDMQKANMLGFYPGNATATNLYAVHGGKGYLIHIKSEAPKETVFTITGEPVLPRIDWKPNSFNFVGFPLADNNPMPTFTSFFAGAPALNNQEVYVLDNDQWQKAEGSVAMAQNEAFWIYCNGSSTFAGSLGVLPPQSTGLHYGDTLVELPLKLSNTTSVVMENIQVSLSSEGTAPDLYYYDNNEWISFSAGAGFSIEAQSDLHVRVGVNRTMIADNDTRTANLKLIDNQGSLLNVPVSVTGIDYKGLWVGYAVINKVNQPRLETEPEPTASEFSFRLIVHNDGSNVHLLREVVMLRYNDNQLILFDNMPSDGNWSGVALRDGQPVGRRISSAAFGFDKKQVLTGNFAEDGQLAVTFSIEKQVKDNDDKVIDGGSPLHPFQHRMHSRHGILTDNPDNPLSRFRIQRKILMKFNTSLDASLLTGIPTIEWGGTAMGGDYKETIEGLQKLPIDIEGYFVLHKVSKAINLQSP